MKKKFAIILLTIAGCMPLISGCAVNKRLRQHRNPQRQQAIIHPPVVMTIQKLHQEILVQRK